MRKTFAAQGFSLGVTLFTQLALTPFLIKSWGVPKFGLWVLITSACAYAVYAELGYTYVAKNLTVSGKARSDLYYTDSYRAAASVVVCLTVLTLGGMLVVASVGLAAADSLPQRDALLCALFLALQALFQTHTLLICSGQRAEMGPAVETALSATVRFTETAAVLLTAQFSESLGMAAMSMCAVRLAFNIASYLQLVGGRPQYAITWPSISGMRRYFRDSISYLLIPLTQSLFVQVPVLVIGWTLSPMQVAVYATTRTLARTGTTFANLLFNSVSPEIARLSGVEPVKVRGLADRMVLAALAFGLLVFAALVTFGDWGMAILTKGRISIVQPFFGLMVLAVTVEILWSSLFNVLAALNIHVNGARVLFTAGVIGSLLVYPAAAKFGLTGAASVLLTSHVVVLLVGCWQYWTNVRFTKR